MKHCQKLPFTEPQARAALATIIREAIMGDRNRHEQVAYECPLCGKWHLSSRERLDGRWFAPLRSEEEQRARQDHPAGKAL